MLLCVVNLSWDWAASPDFSWEPPSPAAMSRVKCLARGQLDGWRVERTERDNPTYIFHLAPVNSNRQPSRHSYRFYSGHSARKEAREIPVCPWVTCGLGSPLNFLRGWVLHLPLPTAAAAAAAAALLLGVVVGNTHAPGIRITALTRISWTSSVFTTRKIAISMAVFRKRRMRCFCVWLFPLVVTAVSAQR